MARARTTSPRPSPWPSPAANPSRPRARHPDSSNRRTWRPSAAAMSPSCRIHISGELSGTADSARLAAARVGIPGGGPGLAHRRHGAGDGCAGRRGRRGGRSGRGGRAGLRRATSWPAPRCTSTCRAWSSCAAADGSAPRPRSGGPCSRSSPSSRWKTARSFRWRRCGRRRRPSRGSRRSSWPTPPPGPRGRPGSPSTTSATRPRPNSSRRSWPTRFPAALPSRSAPSRPCWRPTPGSVCWR